MIQKILVPLDGSSAAEMALPWTEEIAVKPEASITLIMATGHERQDLEPLYRSYLERISGMVQARLASRGAHPPTGLNIRVMKGAPADEILHCSEEERADLIVMSSRGSTQHHAWLIGSIATRVTMHSSKPVLVIKNPAQQVAVEPTKVFKRILVPLDGSVAGEAALPFTEALAQTLGSEIILINAVEPIETWVDNGAGGVYEGMRKPEDDKTIPLAYLGNIQGRLREKGLKVEVVVQDGSPAELIVNYATSEGIDAIAMSTHGRSGVGRWFFGNVTEKVLQYGKPAVFVVHAGEV